MYAECFSVLLSLQGFTMNNKTTDITDPANLQSHDRGTGAVRNFHPIYKDYLPPCNNACPAGEDIQGWLALVQSGDYQQAWQLLMKDNPLPAVHGRVCYHPCETTCNREQLDNSVSIHAVERFLGDKALAENWQISPDKESSGKRILIIGAGPSGLSAAYHLARLGHKVVIYEAGPVAGGMMRFGIPAYRLPREELDQEIHRIESLGVEIVLNRKVENLLSDKQQGNFDAVFVAIGAHLSKRVDIPAQDATKMLDAMSYLQSASAGDAPLLGRKVAIYGGGNTAMDAARTAKRLGAEEALIIYRRDREHMPAHSFEADEALEEGVKINWLRSIKEMDAGSIKVEIMELNEEGRAQPTGRYETLEADSLILAVGQETDSQFLRAVEEIEFQSDGTVSVDQGMMTGAAGIFAGGDMVPSERTVTTAVGHGKKAARHIDAWLKHERYSSSVKHDSVNYEQLHLWYVTEADKTSQASLSTQQRQQNFSEIVSGLSVKEATFEAQRCFSCGNCFECDGCYGACPEKAVIKLGPGKRYKYDYDLCTGCAVCFEQCPCHAIEMVEEKDTATQGAGE